MTVAEIPVWEKVHEEVHECPAGYRKTKMKRFVMPDGEEQDFDIRVIRPAVSILAITSDNKLVLVRQFRPGPEIIVNEIPSGEIDPGETAEQAAARELLDETGYRGALKEAGMYQSGCYSEGHTRVFVATDCEYVREPRKEGASPLQAVIVPVHEFRQMLREGRTMHVGASYFALDYLNLL